MISWVLCNARAELVNKQKACKSQTSSVNKIADIMAHFRLKNIKPPIHEEIAELQRKLQLLEGEKAAQYESSQSIIQQNKDKILQLRQQNKLLHRKLAEVYAADEQVIRDAFQSRMSEKAAYKNMSSKEAVQILDQKVCDKVKKMNALRHITNTKRQHLEQLKTEYNTLRATRPGPLTDGVVSQTSLRMLENQLEKAQLKCQESEYITKSYQKIKEHLQEESLTFQSQLDELECEIFRQQQELRDLQQMNKNAHQAKEAAKAELQQQVSMVYSERRETELILNRYKKQAEEQKSQTDRGERRRVALQTDELSSEAQRSGAEEESISSFEDAFTRIKEATGITDIQDVVDRFITQRDTYKRLEEMKAQKELEVQQLREERDELQVQYETMKYSGESRQSEGRKLLEERLSEVQRVKERRDAAKENVEKLTHVLSTVSNAVENLYDKLQHITLKDGPVHREGASVPVLDMMQAVGLKLMQLQEEVKGHDIHTLTKEMEEQEFHSTIEEKLPDANIRITLPDEQKANLPEEDDDSEEDDGDVISWAALKKQSQFIIESMMKRRKKNKL